MSLYYYGLSDTTPTYAVIFLNIIPLVTFILSLVFRYQISFTIHAFTVSFSFIWRTQDQLFDNKRPPFYLIFQHGNVICAWTHKNGDIANLEHSWINEDRSRCALGWRHNAHQPLQGQDTAPLGSCSEAPSRGTTYHRGCTQSSKRDNILGRQQHHTCLLVLDPGNRPCDDMLLLYPSFFC